MGLCIVNKLFYRDSFDLYSVSVASCLEEWAGHFEGLCQISLQVMYLYSLAYLNCDHTHMFSLFKVVGQWFFPFKLMCTTNYIRCELDLFGCYGISFGNILPFNLDCVYKSIPRSNIVSFYSASQKS